MPWKVFSKDTPLWTIHATFLVNFVDLMAFWRERMACLVIVMFHGNKKFSIWMKVWQPLIVLLREKNPILLTCYGPVWKVCSFVAYIKRAWQVLRASLENFQYGLILSFWRNKTQWLSFKINSLESMALPVKRQLTCQVTRSHKIHRKESSLIDGLSIPNSIHASPI